MNRDFVEFIALLNTRGVKYLIGGGQAVGFHGYFRATKDLDVFVDPSAANLKRLQQAVKDFYGGASAASEDVPSLAVGKYLILGVAPNRIDLLGSFKAFPFKQAWPGRVKGLFGDQPASFINREDLIAEKISVARLQDLTDVEALSRRKKRPVKKSRK